MSWGGQDEEQKQRIKRIQRSQKKLKKFLAKHGEEYVDDGTMVIELDELYWLTMDVDLRGRTGVFFFSLVIDKQSQKLYDINWVILRFLAHEMPTV